MPFFNFPYYRNYYSSRYYPRPNQYSQFNYGNRNFQKYTINEISNNESFDHKNNYDNFLSNQSEELKKEDSTTSSGSSSTTHKESRGFLDNAQPFINILGFELYSDDILILCILLSLYLEGVKDEMLFISLILLLLG